MGQFKGIFSKKFSDGSVNIFARFTYDGTSYPNKNFTKLYGCKTESSAYAQLIEIKRLISLGKDPFSKTYSNLKEIFIARKE